MLIQFSNGLLGERLRNTAAYKNVIAKAHSSAAVDIMAAADVVAIVVIVVGDVVAIVVVVIAAVIS